MMKKVFNLYKMFFFQLKFAYRVYFLRNNINKFNKNEFIFTFSSLRDVYMSHGEWMETQCKRVVLRLVALRCDRKLRELNC